MKWSDGQPLTAGDVAFSYNYMIQNKMANYASAYAAIERAVVVDPLTVRLICSSPKADMLTSYIPIVPEHVWSKISKHAAQNTFTNPPPIIGSGPFETVAFKKGNYVLMKRNPYWWGPKPAIDEIDFEDYTNSDSMYEDLTTGTIDGAVELSPANFQKLTTDKRFHTDAYNFYFWDYVDLNCYDGPSLGCPVLRDVDFRRALATAIDQQTIIKIAWHGFAEPGTTIMNPHSWFNPDYHWEPTGADKFTFDLAKARQMLAAAGYRDVNGDGYVEDKAGKPFTLRLWARSESQPSQVEGKLLTSWWKQIGVHVVFSVVDEGYIDSQFWNTVKGRFTPNFDMYLWDWDGYVDPGADLQTFTTAQIDNWNEPCWSNPEFDRLYKEQEMTLDPAKRQQIDLADAEAPLRGRRHDRAHLPRPPGGLQRRQVDRVDPQPAGSWSCLLHLLQPAHLPEPAPRGRQERRQQEGGMDLRRRGDLRVGHRRRRLVLAVDPESWAAPGRGGVAAATQTASRASDHRCTTDPLVAVHLTVSLVLVAFDRLSTAWSAVMKRSGDLPLTMALADLVRAMRNARWWAERIYVQLTE